MILGKDNIWRLSPPVGTSDWATFSRDSYCVDKTLLIKELIDSRSRVVLFTRPRRFGKTTALNMIRAFYEDEASLFEDKKIRAAGEEYRKEQPENKTEKSSDKSRENYLSFGLCGGMAIGMSIGAALGHLALGMSLGMCAGAGTSSEVCILSPDISRD